MDLTHYFHSINSNNLLDACLYLKPGFDVNATDKHDQTGLMIASTCGAYEIARVLLEYGADPNLQLDGDGTALHLASFHNNEPIVRLLLKYNADVHAVDYENNTALHYAALNGNLDIATRLLFHGTNRELKNHQGLTPEQVAINNDHEFVAMMINKWSFEAEHDKHR